MSPDIIYPCVIQFLSFVRSIPAISRVNGNRKGIFTRARQPKAAAQLVRQRNWLLASELDDDDVFLPEDLFDYVSPRYAAALIRYASRSANLDFNQVEFCGLYRV